MSSDAHTYALLAATYQTSTLHTYVRNWCETFSDEWMLLCANGLDNPDSDVSTPIGEGPKDLAQTVDFDSRDLGWVEEATIYVFADPEMLDESTDDVFRRSLRVLLERLADQVSFPFDHVDTDRRGGWLVACLVDGEIKNPKKKFNVDRESDPE
jgi:hypothetical protein